MVSGREEMIDVTCGLQGSAQAHDNRFSGWQAGIPAQPQLDLHLNEFAELLYRQQLWLAVQTQSR